MEAKETKEEAIPKKPDCQHCTVRHVGCHGKSCPYGWEAWADYHAKQLEDAYHSRVVAATHAHSKEKRLLKKLKGYYNR